MKAFPHQEEALKRLKKRKSYALFMEQGTGKTFTTIKHIQRLVKKGKASRILIFCPTAVMDNWEQELNKFAPGQFMILNFEGKKDQRKEEFDSFNKRGTRPKVLIVNYEKADRELKTLSKFKADVLVCDESHKIKNVQSKVSKRIFTLSKNIPRKYLLTGTPISKGYEDIFSQFKIMKPEILGTSWKEFEEEYLVKGGYMNKQIKGYKHKKRLQKIIDKNSFKVKKEECLKLPPMTEQDVKCELHNKAKKAYNQLDKEMYTEIEAIGIDIKAAKQLLKDNDIKVTKSMSAIKLLHSASQFSSTYEVALEMALTKNNKLQQLCGGFLKLEEEELFVGTNKLELMQDLIETSTKPVVIFCNFRAELTLIKTTLEKKYRVAELSGKTKKKGEVIKDFQSGKFDIIVVQIAAGSAGITLTKSSTMIFYSWNYKYIDYSQAKARIHRIGQENPVNIYYLVTKNTVDEDILEVLRDREKLANKIMK